MGVGFAVFAGENSKVVRVKRRNLADLIFTSVHPGFSMVRFRLHFKVYGSGKAVKSN